jgi:hypothetical protein
LTKFEVVEAKLNSLHIQLTFSNPVWVGTSKENVDEIDIDFGDGKLFLSAD